MKFNRKKFFDGMKGRIDPTLEQSQVDGLEFLLTHFEEDPHWSDIRHIAYALGTVFHETAGSFQPVEEGYYLGSARRVKAFQKTLRYYPYFGRGYVQLTWETRRIPNYSKASKALGIDFVKDPDLVMEPENAFRIMTLGMHEGWFTGKKLSDYIRGPKCDYVNARRIINGLDKAGLIAGYAASFEKILRISSTAEGSHSADSDSSIAKSDTPSPSLDSAAVSLSGKPAARSDGNLLETATDSAPQPPIPPPPASLIPQPTPVIEVEQVSAAKDEPKDEPKKGFLDNVSSRIAAIPAAILSVIGAAWAWLTSAPEHVVVAFLITAGVITVLFIIINSLRNAGKEKRDQKAKELELQLTLEREKQAHEIQLLTLKAAMEPSLNAVRVVPPPVQMPNSDSQGAS